MSACVTLPKISFCLLCWMYTNMYAFVPWRAVIITCHLLPLPTKVVIDCFFLDASGDNIVIKPAPLTITLRVDEEDIMPPWLSPLRVKKMVINVVK